VINSITVYFVHTSPHFSRFLATHLSIEERLVLSQNELKGTIPTTIGALTGLMQLSVDQQELFGVIPSELSLLTALGKNQSLLSLGFMLKY
jgi:hypothetical protein